MQLIENNVFYAHEKTGDFDFEIKSLAPNPWNPLAIKRMYLAHTIWLVDVQSEKAMFQWRRQL